MRISDWSSDVCSSDLAVHGFADFGRTQHWGNFSGSNEDGRQDERPGCGQGSQEEVGEESSEEGRRQEGASKESCQASREEGPGHKGRCAEKRGEVGGGHGTEQGRKEGANGQSQKD